MSQLTVLVDPTQEPMHHFQQQFPVYQAQPDYSTAVVMFTCDHPGCDRAFNRKYTLAEHAMTHTGEKPHVCPVKTCGKSFSTSGNLSRHKRLHGYIEPLACPVQGCICSFPSNNKLVKHMKFHFASEDVKVCVVAGCGKTFSTTGNLNRHIKASHSGVDLSYGHVHANPQRSPTALDQWAPKQQAARGYFEPDCIRPYAPVSFTPVVPPGNNWGSDELDALAGLFETPFATTPVAQFDAHTVDMFQHSLHFEYK